MSIELFAATTLTAPDRTTKAEARIEQTAKQAQAAIAELNSARVHVQAQQSGLDTATREIAEAKEAAKSARAEAKKAGEEAAELRGAIAAANAHKEAKPAAKK